MFVHQLSAACNESTSIGFFKQAKQYEATFKAVDHYIELSESTLFDTDENDEDDVSSSSDEE